MRDVINIELPENLRNALEEYTKQRSPLLRVFTKEEEAFIIEARKIGMPWQQIGYVLRCCKDTARLHYTRELQ